MTQLTKKTITLEKAREIVLKDLMNFLKSKYKSGFLRHEYIEKEHCWMFFIDQNSDVLTCKSLRNSAYIVSKEGEHGLVADYFYDMGLADEMASVMSGYMETGKYDVERLKKVLDKAESYYRDNYLDRYGKPIDDKYLE